MFAEFTAYIRGDGSIGIVADNDTARKLAQDIIAKGGPVPIFVACAPKQEEPVPMSDDAKNDLARRLMASLDAAMVAFWKDPTPKASDE